jgi:hypothetical protein
MRILRGMEAIQRRRTPRCQEMSPDPLLFPPYFPYFPINP